MQSWQQQRATELTTLQEHHERELAAMADRLRHELAAAAADAERRVQHAQTQAQTQAQAEQRHAEAIAHERQSQSRSAVAHEVQSRVDGSVSCDRFLQTESNSLYHCPITRFHHVSPHSVAHLDLVLTCIYVRYVTARSPFSSAELMRSGDHMAARLATARAEAIDSDARQARVCVAREGNNSTQKSGRLCHCNHVSFSTRRTTTRSFGSSFERYLLLRIKNTIRERLSRPSIFDALFLSLLF